MALCSTSDVEKYLQTTYSTAEAERIEYLIDAASANIENICNRAFGLDTYDETYDIDGTEIYLNQYPIVSITSIKYGSPFEASDRTAVESDEYYSEDAQGIISLIFKFRNASQWINVQYSAGYTTIPDDLNMIAVEEVVRSLNQTDRDSNVRSEELGDFSVSYFSSPDNNSNLAKNLVNYMRWYI